MAHIEKFLRNAAAKKFEPYSDSMAVEVRGIPGKLICNSEPHLDVMVNLASHEHNRSDDLQVYPMMAYAGPLKRAYIKMEMEENGKIHGTVSYRCFHREGNVLIFKKPHTSLPDITHLPSGSYPGIVHLHDMVQRKTENACMSIGGIDPSGIVDLFVSASNMNCDVGLSCRGKNGRYMHLWESGSRLAANLGSYNSRGDHDLVEHMAEALHDFGIRSYTATK